MAIRDVVTRGFGNGTYSGTIPLVALRGYGSAEATANQTLSIDAAQLTQDRVIASQIYHDSVDAGQVIG